MSLLECCAFFTCTYTLMIFLKNDVLQNLATNLNAHLTSCTNYNPPSSLSAKLTVQYYNNLVSHHKQHH